MDLAGLDLKGPAEVWFSSYLMGRRNVSWEEFIVDDLGSKVWKISIAYNN